MYDFKKLSDVELLSEVPEGASAFVEVDGDVKRVPGSGLGGGGVATAILRYNTDAEGQNAEGGVAVQASASVQKLPIVCDNYTYAQARAVLEAGQPLVVMLVDTVNYACLNAVAADYADEDYIIVNFGMGGSTIRVYWNADGFYSGDPANYNPK